MTVPEDRRRRIADDPFCATLGIDLVHLEAGRAVTELAVTDDLLNFHGTPHGGAVYSLADAAFAAASNAREADAVALETNISYLESVGVGDRLRAVAEETHLADRTAEYEVVVTRVAGDDGGRNGDGDAEDSGDGNEGVEDAGDGNEGVEDDAVEDDGDRVATFRGRVYRFVD